MYVFIIKGGKKMILFHFVAINFIISKYIYFIAKEEHSIVDKWNRETQQQAIKILIYIQLSNC